MWEKWKQIIRGILFTDVEEENQPEIQQEQTKGNLQAKMTYQYPESKSFRFPVIPDKQTVKQQSDETPAYQRKRNKPIDRDMKQSRNQNQSRNQSQNQNQSPSQSPSQSQKQYRNTRQNSEQQTSQFGKIYKKNNEVPFKLTEVPSPIYGYQQNTTEKKIENTPTFQRRLEVEEEHQKVQVSHQDDEAQIENETRIVSDPLPVFHGEDTATMSEPVEIKETNQQEVPQKKTDVENKRKMGRKKRNPIHQNQADRPKHIPYNVIMTPRDKKNQFDKAAKRTEVKADPIINVQAQAKEAFPYYLLNDPVEKGNDDHIWVEQQQQLLEQTLKHFNVGAKVVKATQGPSVTRFEVQPELGVKVSKVKNLSDDLKLNLSARDIRIEAPIPGKNTIGIEIPNKNSQMVGLQGVFETEQFKDSKSPLTIALGLTIEGLPLITNIQKMPHGLIAGATGSGKSVCINTILISLLYKASHEDVKFLLIDPKMVELAPYNGIPHLVAPVITDVKAATAALKWAVNEMEERYERFVQEGVRDIERYNHKVIKQNRPAEKMPFIVIVIDELADLMMSSPQDVEDAISRIAQKARACGIHLILATQRPSVDVITGLIKANIPTRIAFSVSSQVDSRTIIDSSGAEKLLGRGDMLFVENGAGKSVRLQGPFVSDDEIERVTNHARSIASPNYLFEQEQLLEQINADEEEDILLEEVIQFVLKHNNASTSLLQRQFKIGYNRAARLIDTLEFRGIISGQNGSKPREVLVTNSQIEEMR